MTRLFVSYRRADTAPYAGRLHDHLTACFGNDNVFMDVDSIEPGQDFAEVIARTLAQCDTVLLLIGPRWLDERRPDGGRRIDDDSDYVHMEVAQALQGRLRIIPVLVGGARMPGDGELPPSLRALARRNAVELRDGGAFRRDVEALIAALERPASSVESRATRHTSPRGVTAVVVVSVALTAALVAGWRQWSDDAREPKKAAEAKPFAVTGTSALPRGDTTADTVATDPKGALLRYTRAANRGDAEAMLNLARLHAMGVGTERDLAKAVDWFVSAAKNATADLDPKLLAFGSELANQLQRVQLESSRTAMSPAEFESIKRDIQLLSRLQQAMAHIQNRSDEGAKKALRQIKAG